MKSYKWIIVLLLLPLYGENTVSLAVKHIIEYAGKLREDAPTISVYKEANISEVTKDNIGIINQKIRDIDTNHNRHIYWYDVNKSYRYDLLFLYYTLLLH